MVYFEVTCRLQFANWLTCSLEISLCTQLLLGFCSYVYIFKFPTFSSSVFKFHVSTVHSFQLVYMTFRDPRIHTYVHALDRSTLESLQLWAFWPHYRSLLLWQSQPHNYTALTDNDGIHGSMKITKQSHDCFNAKSCIT